MVDELKACTCWASTDPAHRALCPLHGAGRVLPCCPSGAGGMNYSYALSFDDGLLTINSDGDGLFSFRDDVLDWDEKDYRSAKVLNSEIIAIRDQLNKLFPPRSRIGSPAMTSPPLQSREQEAREMLRRWKPNVGEYFHSPKVENAAISAMIAFADAERERCARIAEEWSIEGLAAETALFAGRRDLRIATAIRNPLYQHGETPK